MDEKHWYIAIVGNNTERATAEKLSRYHTVYLPSQKVVSVWKDGRRKERDKLVIPGKVFVFCTEKERLETLNYSFVKRYMVDIATAPDNLGRRKIAVVPEGQMKLLQFMLSQSDAKVDIDTCEINNGDTVQVVSGALAGMEGIVTDWSHDKPRVHIKIEHLGCASVEVSLSEIQRV